MLNFITSWRREREAVRELTRLSDRELADLGIARSDIRAVAEGTAREAAPRAAREDLGTMPQAWGAYARPSIAA